MPTAVVLTISDRVGMNAHPTKNDQPILLQDGPKKSHAKVRGLCGYSFA
jgi:hypothetical protein